MVKWVTNQQNAANFNRDEEKDADFIVKIVSGNLSEIALAQLAQRRSTSKDIKSIAEMLEKDHTKILGELTTFAAKRGIAVPTKEASGSEIDNNDLAVADAAVFDKKWCNSLVARHQRFIRKFEIESAKTDDVELKSWIEATLYTSKEHLEMLKMYQEKIK